MADTIKDMIFAGIDERIKQALSSKEVQQKIEETVQRAVSQKMGGDALQAAVINAVRASLGAPGPAPKATPVVPTPNHKPSPAGAHARRGAVQACMVRGCTRPHRAMGYCAAHYQSARKHGWPLPATESFTPGPEYRARA